MKNFSVVIATVALACPGVVRAQEAEAQTPTPPVMTKAGAPVAPPPDATKASDLKKYADVITKDAVSQQGVFKVHRIKDKVYWEIPAKLLGRVFMWETEIAQLPSEVGFPGTPAGTRVIRFTRRENKILIRSAEFAVRSAVEGATAAGVEANNIEPIIDQFDVLTEGSDKAAVIDVTSLFTTDPADFSVKNQIGAAGVAMDRSYVDRVKAFPENIETRSQLTFITGGQGNRFFFRRGIDASSVTVIVHYSLDLLPEKPMMGRLKDSRIGYFTSDFTEYGRPENRSIERRYIDRFRLEKKDPNATVSDPVKPITFYLSREVPEKWRPYLKQAIEDWRPAFEQAGFSNAIVAKDAPTVKEDPFWDPEDARYSVIRWLPSTTENAEGPHISDPRSGETLSAHVLVWNDIVKLVEDWYFSQCAAIDPRGRQLPMPDELVGALLRYVVAHEVGHTLGLEHNFKASTAYTIAELRDPKFTETYGMAASIMSYSRYDYVAQPGDGIKWAWGKVGPYDKFAIEYGYKVLPGVRTPDDEKSALDAILARQVTHPWLRFGNYVYYGIDPTTQNENISNDPLEAGRLGLLNIDLIAKKYLLPAGSKFGEDYTRLTELLEQLDQQRFTELNHIVQLVGGVVETDYHAGRGGEVFSSVPPDRQRAAVRFLVLKGFQTPKALYDPKILNLVEPGGNVDQSAAYQSALLSDLLEESRLHRLEDSEALIGAKAYTVANLLNDVTYGAWAELYGPHPSVDVYRRGLQRTFLKTLDSKINGSNRTQTDLVGLARITLRELAVRIDKAIPHAANRITAVHLLQSRADIEKILEGKYSVPGQAPQFSFGMFGLKNELPCFRREQAKQDANPQP